MSINVGPDDASWLVNGWLDGPVMVRNGWWIGGSMMDGGQVMGSDGDMNSHGVI